MRAALVPTAPASSWWVRSACLVPTQPPTVAPYWALAGCTDTWHLAFVARLTGWVNVPLPGPLHLMTLVLHLPSPPFSVSRFGCPSDYHHYRLPHHGHSCSDYNSCLKKLVRILGPCGKRGLWQSLGGVHRKIPLYKPSPRPQPRELISCPPATRSPTALGQRGRLRAPSSLALPFGVVPSLRHALKPASKSFQDSPCQAAGVPVSESFLSDAHLGTTLFLYLLPAVWVRAEPAPCCPGH